MAKRRKWAGRHRVQGPLILALYHLFRLLPLDAASGSAGWIGRRLGPR